MLYWLLILNRNFAENVGIKFFTPEEYFLKETPRPFTRTFEPGQYTSANTTGWDYEVSVAGRWFVSDIALVSPEYKKENPIEIVILCGSPGAGKSTFYWKQLEPLGFHRVNQDILKTVCAAFAGDYSRWANVRRAR